MTQFLVSVSNWEFMHNALHPRTTTKNMQFLKWILSTSGAAIFSSPEQRSGRAIVLPPASTNVKVFVKVFKTSLFPNLITDLIHLWYDDTYWSNILRSTIPTTLGHVKVKVTDLEFKC